MSHRARGIVVGVALVAAALTLSGCSAIGSAVSNITHAALGTGEPREGQCWAASSAVVTGDASWRSGPAVACSRSHDLYTYAVPTIEKTFSGSWLTSDGTGTARTEVDDAAYNTCMDSLDSFLPGLDDHETRLYFAYYLPPVASWLKGARWVRCDIAAFTIGTLVSKPTFEPLPTDIQKLVDTVQRDADFYHYCFNTSEDSTVDADPLNSDTARFADCTASPQWHESYDDYFPDDSSASYPSEDTIYALEDKACGPPLKDGVVTIAYPPTRESWARGDRLVECWASAETAPSA